MFQNKKIIISSLLLLLIAVGFVIPQKADASFLGSTATALIAMPVALTGVIAETLYSCMTMIVSGTAIDVAYTPHEAGWGNNNPVVDDSWKICRDLANMLIVLGFVVIAIATILRFREYEAQKLLPSLIIVAILVNFSPVICGLFIDASNITMDFFLQGTPVKSFIDVEMQIKSLGIDSGDLWKILTTVGVGAGAGALVGNIPGAIIGGILGGILGILSTGSPDLSDVLMAGGTYLFINIVGILTYGLMFFLLLARYVMLWILVIFSPIAFVCYVFPFSKQYFKAWWDNFFKWCIMGIPVAFTLYLAASANQLLSKSPSGAVITDFFMPGMIMLVGFFYSLKFSGAGAAIAMGAMAATGSFALGAITGGAKGKGVLGKIGAGLGNAIGGSRAATAVREKLGGGLTAMKEMTGLAPGATAERNAKLRKDAHPRLDAMTSDALAKYNPVSEAVRAERTTILAGRGNLDKLGNKKDIEVQRAIAHGEQRSVFEKSDYRTTAYNTEKIGKVAKEQGIPIAAAKQKVVEAQLEANLPSMSHGQLRGIDLNDLTYDIVKKRLTPDKISAFRIGSNDQINKLRSYAKPLAAESLKADKGERKRLKKLIDEIARL